MWGTIFKLLAGAALAGLTIYAGVKIYKKITAQRIAEEVAKKAKAVYAKIKEKKANAVKVGIFDVNEKETGEMEIKSDEGVDSSLRVGQLIAVI